MKTEKLIDILQDNLAPVKKESLWMTASIWMTVSSLWWVFLLFLNSFHYKIIFPVPDLNLTALILFFSISVFSAVRENHPLGNSSIYTYIILLFILFRVLSEGIPAMKESTEGSFSFSHLLCPSEILLFSIVPLFLFGFLFRKGYSVNPGRQFMITAAASLCIGEFFLRFICRDASLVHLFVWHFLFYFPIGLLFMPFSIKLFRSL